jgi:hypothetical protein
MGIDVYSLVVMGIEVYFLVVMGLICVTHPDGERVCVSDGCGVIPVKVDFAV